MIGIGFKVEVKKSKLLTEPQRALALPMLDATTFLADLVLNRIRQGMGPHGPWSTYGAGSTDNPDTLFWVMPGRPQPGEPGKNGCRLKLESGPWAGWAAYDSVEAYYRLRGLAGKPHDFEETGRLLRAAAIRTINPRHMRLAFYGSHGKLSAKQVAWLTSRDEAFPLLMPSPSEVERFQRYITGRINAAVVEGARLGAESQRLSAASRSVHRRASKLLGD